MKCSNITLNQRLAIAKAYLDDSISLRMIADLADIQPNDIATIAKAVLGPDFFRTRYKNNTNGKQDQ